jgi:hypothetical protein
MLIQPVVGFAETDYGDADFGDTQGHWARDTIEKYHQKGMAKGYPDNTFAPDQKIKQSEMAAFINRYLGFSEEAADNFADVKNSDWFFSETAKAKYYGYIEAMNARPEEPASREDVVRALSLILDLGEQQSAEETKEFKDIEDLSGEARENIERFSELGYIEGYEDGTFRTQGAVSRAEILTIMERALGYIVATQEDAVGIPDSVGKVTIIRPGITIEGKTISGNIYITAGAKGKTTIRDTKVTGTIEIAGGEILLDGVTARRIAVAKAKETPLVRITRSQIEELDIKTKAEVEIKGGSEIGRAETNAEAGIQLGDGAKVGSLTANGKTDVTGKGKIKRTYVYTDQMTMQQDSGYMRVYSGGKVEVGEKTITRSNDDHHSSSGNQRTSVFEDGTAEHPYLIETIEDLARLGTTSDWAMDKSYRLMNDLDFESSSSYESGAVNQKFTSGSGWIPIGTYTGSDEDNPFTGIFDGNEKTISNLFVSRSDICQGLFGFTSGAVISGLEMTGAKVSATDGVGGIIGYALATSVSACSISGEVSGDDSSVGGIAGALEEGRISACTADVAVSGNSNVGGIAGQVEGGIITSCNAFGTAGASYHLGGIGGYVIEGSAISDSVSNVVLGQSASMGGIAGNLYDSSIRGCRSSSDVGGHRDVGGIVGFASRASVTDSHSTGNISGENSLHGASPYCIGGIAGNASSTTISACHSAGDVSAEGYSLGGVAGSASGSYIIDSHSTGAVDGENYTGGIAGYSNRTTIKGCYSNGNIYGKEEVGGIAGSADDCNVSRSYSTGNIDGYSAIGGAVGYAEQGCEIENCYATGDVSGNYKVGGIIGEFRWESMAVDCYSTGKVSGIMFYGLRGGDPVGGIAGQVINSSISSCTALGGSITGALETNRIVGYFGGSTPGELFNNYANDNMLVNGTTAIAVGEETVNGSDIESITSTAVEPLLSWNFDDTWKLDGDMCRPTLIGVGNDDAIAPQWQSSPSADTGVNEGDINLTASMNETGTIYYAVVTNGSAALTKESIKYGSGHAATGSAASFDLFAIDGLSLGSYYDIYIVAQDEAGNNGNVESVIGIQAKPIDYGDGSENNPFKIYKIEDLARIGSDAPDSNGNTWGMDKHYKLNNDLDFNSVSSYANNVVNDEFTSSSSVGGWTPIGSLTTEFEGTFDGDGKTISNLFINRTNENYKVQGLFGYTSGAEIRDIGLLEADIKGYFCVGGIVGKIVNNSIISDCYLTGSISGNNRVGGIAGQIEDSTISSCYSTGTVTGTYYSGGIAGYVYSNSVISSCYSTGTVTGKNYDGGIAGKVDSSAILTCYSTGDISGETYYTGGIAGFVDNYSTISNNYATGAVSGNLSAGGIGGLSSGSAILSCAAFNESITGSDNVNRVVGSYNTGTISNNYANSGMLVNGLTAIEVGEETVNGADIDDMTSTDLQPLAGWDFDVDSDGDNAYWKIEWDRPVLYVDKDDNGIYVKLGTDDGRISWLHVD